MSFNTRQDTGHLNRDALLRLAERLAPLRPVLLAGELLVILRHNNIIGSDESMQIRGINLTCLIRDLMTAEDEDRIADILLAANQRSAGPVSPALQVALYADAEELQRVMKGHPINVHDLVHGLDRIVSAGLLDGVDQDTMDSLASMRALALMELAQEDPLIVDQVRRYPV